VGVAFVQPLLDLLRHNSDFFVARGNTSGDILWFSLGLVLVPPALLLAIESRRRAAAPTSASRCTRVRRGSSRRRSHSRRSRAPSTATAAPIAVRRPSVLGVAFAAANARAAAPVRSFHDGPPPMSPAPVALPRAVPRVPLDLRAAAAPEAAGCEHDGPPAKDAGRGSAKSSDELSRRIVADAAGRAHRTPRPDLPGVRAASRADGETRKPPQDVHKTVGPGRHDRSLCPAILSGQRPSKKRAAAERPCSLRRTKTSSTLLGEPAYRQHVVEAGDGPVPGFRICGAGNSGGRARRAGSAAWRSDLSVVPRAHLMLARRPCAATLRPSTAAGPTSTGD
jgi:hypothetical protein